MERGARPETTELEQLEADAIKTPEALEGAELLPGGDVQVADDGGPLLHGMHRAQANDLTARLQALPDNIIPILARAIGRPTRRASKLLKDAYGALDCGLRLDGVTSRKEIIQLLSGNMRRFHDITALELTLQANEGCLYPASFLRALPTAFPRLQSLSFPDESAAAGAHLSRLAPLAPTLTALRLPRLPSAGPLLEPPRFLALTALRSLCLPCSYARDNGWERLAALSELRQLQHLEVRDDYVVWKLPAAACLPVLCALSSLTSLAVGPFLNDFDAAALAALSTALPKLSAFRLNPVLGLSSLMPSELQNDLDHPASATEVVAALAARTALTALRLRIVCSGNQVDLRCCSALRSLARLELDWCLDWAVNQLVPLVAGAKALTHLAVTGGNCCLALSTAEAVAALGGGMRALTLEAKCESPSCIQALMGGLSMLTELRLVGIQFSDAAGGPLPAALDMPARLRVLEVQVGARGLLDAVLRGLGGLELLQDLALGSEWSCEEEEKVSDADLQLLLPVGRSLTRLELGNPSMYEPLITAPGLALMVQFPRLVQLKVRNVAALENFVWRDCFPLLPARLRMLELQCFHHVPHKSVEEELRAAMQQQDGVLRMGIWA